MKEKMMYLILGILIGAVITAGCFLVFSKNNAPQGMGGEKTNFSNMTDEEREEMMQNRGQRGGEDGEPPAMPGEGNTVNNDAVPETSEGNTVTE